jgi:hypothetical protein
MAGSASTPAASEGSWIDSGVVRQPRGYVVDDPEITLGALQAPKQVSRRRASLGGSIRDQRWSYKKQRALTLTPPMTDSDQLPLSESKRTESLAD